MNFEEYEQKLKELKSIYEREQVELMKEFIRLNNPHNIGDKVTDHIGSVVIEKLKYSYGFGGQPCAVYVGYELKKDGTPTKNKKIREVYQSNLL